MALIVMVFQLVLSLVAAQWSAIDGQDPLVGGFAFIALAILGAIFFLQTPNIAAGIAGGASAGLADFGNAVGLGSQRGGAAQAQTTPSSSSSRGGGSITVGGARR
jgi:type IV secretion system protein VirB6